jgi:hypothetical protein
MVWTPISVIGNCSRWSGKPELAGSTTLSGTLRYGNIAQMELNSYPGSPTIVKAKVPTIAAAGLVFRERCSKSSPRIPVKVKK